MHKFQVVVWNGDTVLACPLRADLRTDAKSKYCEILHCNGCDDEGRRCDSKDEAGVRIIPRGIHPNNYYHTDAEQIAMIICSLHHALCCIKYHPYKDCLVGS